jgi:hypothetical protein
MFIFIHLILGLLIGSILDSKILIIITAFLSHFLLDYFPHWDGFFDKEYFERTGTAYLTKKDLYIASIDFILAILTIFIFWHYIHYSNIDYNKTNIILGGFASIFPDLMKIGYATDLKNQKLYNKYLKFHSNIQKHEEVDWKIRLVLQALFLITLILVIIYFLFT